MKILCLFRQCRWRHLFNVKDADGNLAVAGGGGGTTALTRTALLAAVTATGAGRVAILTAGMGVTNAVASFTSSASGALRIGGNITATGAVTLDGAVETWANAVTGKPSPLRAKICNDLSLSRDRPMATLSFNDHTFIISN